MKSKIGALPGGLADHMALSPAGDHVIVSNTLASQASVLDAHTGQQLATFATGAFPHGNEYSREGSRIYNASIGILLYPQSMEAQKGPRQLTVVDANSFQVIRTYQFDHGVRPAVFTADELTMYAQLSYLNGFVEFDLTTGTITRTVELPLSDDGAVLSPDDYPNDAAHHGLAMSGDGSKLCAAGTISDYVAIVSVPALLTDQIIPVADTPAWTTTSVDGNRCFVSNAGANIVTVVDYRTSSVVTTIPVGDFPKKSRVSAVPESVVSTLNTSAG